MIMVQGKQVIIRGGRCFAVRKTLTLTDRIANAHHVKPAYERQMSVPHIKLRSSRKISNKNF